MHFIADGYENEELILFLILKITGSNTKNRKKSQSIEQVCTKFLAIHDRKTMDIISLQKSDVVQPRLVSVRDDDSPQYGLIFDKKVLWISKSSQSLAIAVSSWVQCHYVFNLAVEETFRGLFDFLAVCVLEIEDNTKCSSTKVQQLVDTVEQFWQSDSFTVVQ